MLKKFLHNFNLKKILTTIGVFNGISLLCIVAILGVFFFYFFRQSEQVVITIKVTSDNVFTYGATPELSLPKSEFVSLIRPGMKQINEIGRTTSEVLKVQVYNVNSMDKAVFADVRLNVAHNKRSGQYSFKERPLLVGSKVELNFAQIFIEGLVTDIEGLDTQHQYKDVFAEAQIEWSDPILLGTKGIPNYMVEGLSIGDTVKDIDGNVLIEILDKQVKPADQLILTSGGQAVVAKSPIRYDVSLLLRIRAKKIHNELWFYDISRIMVGESLSVVFDKIAVYPVITKIYEEDPRNIK